MVVNVTTPDLPSTPTPKNQTERLREVSYEDFTASVAFYRKLFNFLATNIEMAGRYEYVTLIQDMESIDDLHDYILFLATHE